MPLRINGLTTGSVTLSAPDNGGNTTLTLPSVTDTLLREGGGKILQTVSATHSTAITSTTVGWVTTNLSASITPSRATSRVLVIASLAGERVSENLFSAAFFGLFRGTVGGTLLQSHLVFAGAVTVGSNVCLSFLDSPSTTSSQTYTVGMLTNSSSTQIRAHTLNNVGSIILQEVSL